MKAFALFIAIFAIAPAAHAAVLISTVTYPTDVQPGQSFDVAIEVQRTGSGCANNWGATEFIIGGATTTFSYAPLDYTQGTGTSSATHTLVAPAAGTHAFDINVYRGNEVNPNNCDTSIIEDTFSDTLEVVSPPAPAPQSKGSSVSGGGGYMKCSFWDGWTVSAEHRCLADNGQFVLTNSYRSGSFGSTNLIGLYTQVVSKLHQMISLMQ